MVCGENLGTKVMFVCILICKLRGDNIYDQILSKNGGKMYFERRTWNKVVLVIIIVERFFTANHVLNNFQNLTFDMN